MLIPACLQGLFFVLFLLVYLFIDLVLLFYCMLSPPPPPLSNRKPPVSLLGACAVVPDETGLSRAPSLQACVGVTPTSEAPLFACSLVVDGALEYKVAPSLNQLNWALLQVSFWGKSSRFVQTPGRYLSLSLFFSDKLADLHFSLLLWWSYQPSLNCYHQNSHYFQEPP